MSSSYKHLGLTPDILNAQRVTLTQRKDTNQSVLARKKLLVGPSDDETAPLIALYNEYEGNMTGIFSELGESPRKALKYPPKDALDFANQFIAGKLTDYAAPKVKIIHHHHHHHVFFGIYDGEIFCMCVYLDWLCLFFFIWMFTIIFNCMLLRSKKALTK
jgi:hypothetical protein